MLKDVRKARWRWRGRSFVWGRGGGGEGRGGEGDRRALGGSVLGDGELMSVIERLGWGIFNGSVVEGKGGREGDRGRVLWWCVGGLWVGC